MSFITSIKNIFKNRDIFDEDPKVQNSPGIPYDKEPEIEEVNLGFGGAYNLSLSYSTTFQTIKDLIREYRMIAQYPEVNEAINEIVNEAIVQDGTDIVQLNIENEEIKESIKNKIIEEFNIILSKMNFNNDGDIIFRQWYEDGRIYLHSEIDMNSPKKGIQKIRTLNPFNLSRIKKDGQIFFIYEDVKNQLMLQIPQDHISFCHSTLTDPEKDYYIGHLHKAIKPYNQLKLLEDAAIIYRLTRAPERRVFYIDTGSMNSTKSDAYISSLMNKFKNKFTYDSITGKIDQQKSVMTMIEDFWLPQSESGSGSRGTRIEVLPGGMQLSEMNDITYFNKKLKKSLNVPFSRFDVEQRSTLGFGIMNGEISRDEVRFFKFISKLRYNFSQLFYDLLKKQLLFKNIINIEEWENIKDEIKFIWNVDSYYAEVKDTEILKNRIELAQQLTPYIGKYYSHEFVKKEIFKMTNDEIKNNEKQIAEEQKNNLLNSSDEEE